MHIWIRTKRFGQSAWGKIRKAWRQNRNHPNDSSEQKMNRYPLTWVTDNLATGHAPMSYDDLDAIREQGIDAIVNLCGEFCDLHELEENSGFEVYYLPIPDECAPDMAEMEKALAWLDEAFYLGKKVLVHCRHGIGRTGTFVTSYLLRKGLGLKLASKKLRKIKAQPSSFIQWKLLKRYGTKEGVLKIREPSLESRKTVDLGIYFAEYEALTQKIDETVRYIKKDEKIESCGLETDACCYRYLQLQLIEAIYLTNAMNRTLKSDARMTVIQDAVEIHKKIQQMKKGLGIEGNFSQRIKAISDIYTRENIRCPLNRESRCIIYPFRPLACRLHDVSVAAISREDVRASLDRLSRNVFLAFSGSFLNEKPLMFSLAETVSGKYVQEYFYYLSTVITKSQIST